MFTGIVEDLGVVKHLAKEGGSARLSVETKICASDAKKGDSISINGACLTVVGKIGSVITFDVSTETLERANLAALKAGQKVNVERSLKVDSRLGGHFVTGHIDTAAKIASKQQRGDFIEFEIGLSDQLLSYAVEKGSIAIDGISLTINKISRKGFSVLLIPHTISMTTLGFKGPGDSVNIEVDILAKYTQRLIRRPTTETESVQSNVTADLLKQHGFI